MSKEERAKIAIAKRAQEIKEQKEKELEQKSARDTFEKEADQLRYREREREPHGRFTSHNNNRCMFSLFYYRLRINNAGSADDDRNHRGRGGKEDRDRPAPPARPTHRQDNIPTGPRADRSRVASSSTSNNARMLPPDDPSFTPNNAMPSGTTAASAPFVPPMTDDDLSAIRTRYLGVDKKKRKIRKMNDKKFVFDWDELEDTFSGAPVDMGARGAALMFGRGHLAGMDGDNVGSRESERHADPMERRKASKAGVDERHWSDKPLSEMKERDWRIFREDFSISARGNAVCHLLSLNTYPTALL